MGETTDCNVLMLYNIHDCYLFNIYSNVSIIYRGEIKFYAIYFVFSLVTILYVVHQNLLKLAVIE